MPNLHELNQHTPTANLVAQAHDEVRRLCLGPGHPGGRRWTMRVPVQADDSDIVISEALCRTWAELQQVQQERETASREAYTAGCERDRLRLQVGELNNEREQQRAILREVNRALCQAKPGVHIGMSDFAEVIRELAAKAAASGKAPDAA